jgi:hypothetical protein
MKHLSAFFIALMFAAGAAQANCYADYKAKQDDPLQLQYGVAEIYGDCSVDGAWTELDQRLYSNGWQLLEVISVFDDAGLDERRDSAGDNFLRY